MYNYSFVGLVHSAFKKLKEQRQGNALTAAGSSPIYNITL